MLAKSDLAHIRNYCTKCVCHSGIDLFTFDRFLLQFYKPVCVHVIFLFVEIMYNIMCIYPLIPYSWLILCPREPLIEVNRSTNSSPSWSFVSLLTCLFYVSLFSLYFYLPFFPCRRQSQQVRLQGGQKVVRG